MTPEVAPPFTRVTFTDITPAEIAEAMREGRRLRAVAVREALSGLFARLRARVIGRPAAAPQAPHIGPLRIGPLRRA